MQVKTIKRTLIKKLNEWIASINAPELRKKLKDNILVSGGSIASMFLREQINDYDIYIKDIDVLRELTEYYTNPFPEITILDGREKYELIKSLTGEHDIAEKEAEKIHNSYSISLRNLKEDQIKLFFDGQPGFSLEKREEKKDSALDEEPKKEEEKRKYRPLYFSPNAISLSDDLQIVIRFWGDNEQIHKTFDFMHATNYFTFKDGLVTNSIALESLLTKQLIYQGSLYPVTSIIRMKKFINRGWKINAGEILKILFQVSQLDLTNPDVLEEQLIGVDVAYFSRLIDILRGENKESITSEYLNTIIDKVFNEGDEEI